jgi:prepilin-type N-terminal cleavage/methylation domain-containing protein
MVRNELQGFAGRPGMTDRLLTVSPGRCLLRGFTLIELLVVLAIVALLLSIAAPRYFWSLGRSREAVLKENLFLLREAIDQYHADLGRYPASLEELVEARHLRRVLPGSHYQAHRHLDRAAARRRAVGRGRRLRSEKRRRKACPGRDGL